MVIIIINKGGVKMFLTKEEMEQALNVLTDPESSVADRTEVINNIRNTHVSGWETLEQKDHELEKLAKERDDYQKSVAIMHQQLNMSSFADNQEDDLDDEIDEQETVTIDDLLGGI